MRIHSYFYRNFSGRGCSYVHGFSHIVSWTLRERDGHLRDQLRPWNRDDSGLSTLQHFRGGRRRLLRSQLCKSAMCWGNVKSKELSSWFFSYVQPITIQRWPVTRDSVIYIFNVIVLVVMIWDDKIMWWETCILLVLYVLYFIIMFNSKNMYNCAQKSCTKDDLIVENGNYDFSSYLCIDATYNSFD